MAPPGAEEGAPDYGLGFFPSEEGVIPRYPDLDYTYKLLKDVGDRMYPQVNYYMLDVPFDQQYTDDVHFEVPEFNKRWKPPVRVKVYVVPDKEKQVYRESVVESERDMVMTVSVPHMVEAGLARIDAVNYEVNVLARVGDRFVYFDRFVYDVGAIEKGDTFANTDIPLFYRFTTTRFRGEADWYSSV